MAIYQGDFGKGQSTGSGLFSDPGANPCLLYGPIPAPTSTGSGILLPPFRVGTIINGSEGSEFILGKLTLAGLTDLLPGQAYFLDKDFNLTLMSAVNGNNILGNEVGVLNVFANQAVAGVYFAWMQRAGHAAVQAAAGSVATGAAETGGVAGQLKFPAAPTAAQKSVSTMTAFNASSSLTFTANTVNGSPTLSNISSITDLQVGAVITGAGLPANAIIAAIRRTGNTWAADIGTNVAATYTTLQNCTATASAVVMTVTNMVTANIYWPTLAKQN